MRYYFYDQLTMGITYGIIYVKEGSRLSKEKPTAKERYDAKNAKIYGIKVIKTTESDIWSKLESVPNKSGYIKSLIRKDIKGEVK